MKKLLTICLMLLTGFVYGQNYKSITATTQTRTTSTLIWNYDKKEFDFHSNEDLQSFQVDWNFVLNGTKGVGTITSNNVTYDVTSIKSTTREDGTPMLVMDAIVLNLNKPVVIALTIAGDGESMFVAVYDYKARKSYYFR